MTDWTAGTKQVTKREVFLQPVYVDGEHNKSWSQWTPAGEIRMEITNPDAFQQFENGDTFFVDFIKIDDKTEQPV